MDAISWLQTARITDKTPPFTAEDSQFASLLQVLTCANELGLTLKALRALELVLTVEPKDLALRREHDERSAEQRLDQIPQPAVDLSSILSRSTKPTAWQTTAEPFRIHDWDTSSSSAERTSPPEPRKPRPTKKRKRAR